MPGIEEYLDECYREEFARVVASWELRDVQKHVSSSFAYYEAKDEEVQLRLLNERGCIGCEVRSGDEKEDFMGMGTLVQLIDYIGKNSPFAGPGIRRLSLKEQCDILVDRKEDVRTALSLVLAKKRRSVISQISAAYTAQFTKKANQPPEPTRQAGGSS